MAVLDGAPGDITYGGQSEPRRGFGDFPPGGASRIPDGTDTDTTADWVRNDFDLAGIPGFTGTPRRRRSAEHAGRGERARGSQAPRRGAHRHDRLGAGSGAASPVVGSTVDVEGVVTGDFQAAVNSAATTCRMRGDDNAATSDGIFVFAPGGVGVASATSCTSVAR